MDNRIEQLANDFWGRVKVLLKSQNKTQSDLCQHCNINLQTLRGKISRPFSPSISEIIDIAEYLNVSTSFLITGKSEDELYKPKQIDTEKLRSALSACLEMLKD